METIFNVREVFEIAEQIERTGSVFYKNAAKITKEADHKKFLLELAAMEDDHEKRFHSLKEEFTEKLGDEFSDIDNQALAYLRAVGSGAVFDINNDSSKQLTGKETLEEIYKLAIEFEKETVVYFTSIKNIVPESFGKNKIDLLITEEIRHIMSLSKQLNEMKK